MSTPLSENSTGPLRAAVVAVQLPDADDDAFAASIAELKRLGHTLGVEIVATVTQRRQSLHAGSVIGSGKLAQLVALAGGGGGDGDEEGAGDGDADEGAGDGDDAGEGVGRRRADRSRAGRSRHHAVAGAQPREGDRRRGARPHRRHPRDLPPPRRSRAAKAQVEIVRLQYLVPRLREQGRAKGQDRQRGGIGGKGAGESSLELDRRKIRDRIAELTRDLAVLENEQRTQRARRRDAARVAAARALGALLLSSTARSRVSSAMRSRILRRSSSRLDSPAPLPPMPPRWRSSPLARPCSRRRGARYCRRTISTWALAARERAWRRKISRMTAVRSSTSTPVAFSRLRACDGVMS